MSGGGRAPARPFRFAASLAALALAGPLACARPPAVDRTAEGADLKPEVVVEHPVDSPRTAPADPTSSPGAAATPAAASAPAAPPPGAAPNGGGRVP
jgi:hypothetical protein